jgi:PPM family protein phosphatase
VNDLIDYAGLTDVGCLRSSNQDRWGADAEQGLFVVADGVAGSTDGALAAHLVVELLPTYARRYLNGDAEPEQLGRAVAEMSNDIFLAGLSNAALTGATSTVVAASISGSQALVAHLGDSRAYLFRAQELQQLTRDHSVVQALIDSGEIDADQAARHPSRNVIMRYAAMPPPAEPDVMAVDLEAGDRVLLCSDGLYGVVDAATLIGILTEQRDPADACAALIEAARKAGGPDNITALVIEIAGE